MPAGSPSPRRKQDVEPMLSQVAWRVLVLHALHMQRTPVANAFGELLAAGLVTLAGRPTKQGIRLGTARADALRRAGLHWSD